jgi:hypothetical protein
MGKQISSTTSIRSYFSATAPILWRQGIFNLIGGGRLALTNNIDDTTATKNSDPASLMHMVYAALKETLGDSAAEALVFHLNRYISRSGRGNPSLKDVEFALSDMFGPGAEILMDAIWRKLEDRSQSGDEL